MSLDQRLNDIKYWKEELEGKLDGVFHEIEALEEYWKRVEKAIESIQEPLHIAQTCLANRCLISFIEIVINKFKKIYLFQGEAL